MTTTGAVSRHKFPCPRSDPYLHPVRPRQRGYRLSFLSIHALSFKVPPGSRFSRSCSWVSCAIVPPPCPGDLDNTLPRLYDGSVTSPPSPRDFLISPC